MTNQVLFISEAKLKENSNVLENVDAKYVRNAILKAQRMKCLPVLGSDLYNKISDLIISGDISLSANSVYKNLLDNELQQSTMYGAIADLMVDLSFKITTKGMIQFANENSEPLSLDQINFMVQRYENNCDYWLNRMSDYLEQFRSQLPEYSNPNTADDRTIEPDLRKPWFNSIYFRGYPNSAAYWNYMDNRPNPNV